MGEREHVNAVSNNTAQMDHWARESGRTLPGPVLGMSWKRKHLAALRGQGGEPFAGNEKNYLLQSTLTDTIACGTKKILVQ